MGPRPLKIDELLLDTSNPRFGRAPSQRDALQEVIDDQKEKLFELASSIVEEGMSPIDRLLVVKDSEDKAGRFITLEGNRRTAALKILAAPSILNGMRIKPALQKRFDTLAKSFNRSSVEPIDGYEVDTREDATTWLYLRHTGENNGRGVVGWTGVASQRFRGTHPALQALEFVAAHGALTDKQKEQLGNRFPITTLDRLLSAKPVRERIGVTVKDGKLLTALPADEVMKALRKMVLDLAEKKINVSGLKNKEQQKQYLDEWDAADRPNLKKAGDERAIEGIPDTEFKSTGIRAKRKHAHSKVDPNDRRTLVPRGVKLNVSNSKTSEIFKELRILKLEDHRHAIAVLLRVFLELSIDCYLDRHKMSKTFTNPKDGRAHDKSLKDKLKDVIGHLESQGVDKRDFVGMVRSLTLPQSPLHIDLLHGYVHNQFVTPKVRDLMDAWNESQSFFEKVWP